MSQIGTAAHWVAQQFFRGRGGDIGTVAENGVTIDDEMMNSVIIYVNDVRSTVRQDQPAELIHIEETVHCGAIHDQCWGTPDLWVADPSISTLFLWDYKHGHKPVDAEWNWQAGAYLAGILPQVPFEVTDVVIRIVQPRAYGHPSVKEWRPRMQIVDEMIQQIAEAAHNALSPNPKLSPGVSQCENCRAAHCCPALQRVTLGLIDKAYMATPMNLSSVDTGRELAALDRAFELISARRDALIEQASAMIRRGERVPGWMLSAGNGRTKWSVPDTEIISMAALMGVNVAKQQTAITPLQAKKAGLPSEMVDAFCTQQPGSMKLVQRKEIRSA